MHDVRLIGRDHLNGKYYVTVCDDDGNIAYLFIEDTKIRNGDVIYALPEYGLACVSMGAANETEA